VSVGNGTHIICCRVGQPSPSAPQSLRLTKANDAWFIVSCWQSRSICVYTMYHIHTRTHTLLIINAQLLSHVVRNGDQRGAQLVISLPCVCKCAPRAPAKIDCALASGMPLLISCAYALTPLVYLTLWFSSPANTHQEGSDKWQMTRQLGFNTCS